MEQDGVSDVCMNHSGSLWVERLGVFEQIPFADESNSWLDTFVALSARYNCVPQSSATIEGHLPCGSRIQICQPPIVDKTAFVIRRHAPTLKTMHDYADMAGFDNPLTQDKAFNPIVANDIDLTVFNAVINAVKSHKNIIVSGSTGSGKTTLLKALIGEIGLDERLVFLEDTPELHAPHQNLLRLCARGDESYNMQFLLKTALRCRPDRILMGELRGSEAFDFISSLNSGHGGGMATIHAGSVAQTWQRLIHLYKQNNNLFMTNEEILAEVKAVIDVIIVIKKTKSGRACVDFFNKGS